MIWIKFEKYIIFADISPWNITGFHIGKKHELLSGLLRSQTTNISSEWFRCPVARIGRNIPVTGKNHNYNIVSPESTTMPRLPRPQEVPSTFWSNLWLWLLNWCVPKKMFLLNSGYFYICDFRAIDIWHVVRNSKIFYTKQPSIYHRLSNSGKLQYDFISCLVWISSHNHSDMVNDIIDDRINTLRMDKPIDVHVNLDKMKLDL